MSRFEAAIVGLLLVASVVANGWLILEQRETQIACEGKQ